jgi:hypothetical protein
MMASPHAHGLCSGTVVPAKAVTTTPPGGPDTSVKEEARKGIEKKKIAHSV